jgi:nitronate monooxygenase
MRGFPGSQCLRRCRQLWESFRHVLLPCLKERNIAWFATATTLAEARIAADADADAIIAQGFEAGGHRGSFDHAAAEREAVGLFALLPCLVDHIDLPVIAAGGIGDARRERSDTRHGVSALS